MAEIEPATPVEAPRPPAPNMHDARPGHVFATFGAFILAFVCGIAADRQLASTPVGRIVTPAGIVAGIERPPGWIRDFADAFCNGDASFIVAHVGGELAQMPEDQIAAALAKPKWTCSRIRYLGHANSPESDSFLFVTTMTGGEEMWWVFAVVEEKVVAIQ